MDSFLLAVSLGALCIAVGQYVLYNIIMVIAGALRPPNLDYGFTPPITVIIPAYNEEKHIRRKLENVLESDYPRELLHVVVADDGSTDETAEQTRAFEARGVRLIRTAERRGKIYAQKMAFSQASTDIVAITDTTVLTPADGIRKLASHMSNPRVGAVSASMSVRNRTVNFLTRISQFLFDIQNAQKLGESRLDSAAGLFGQFSLVRRDAVRDFPTDVIYEDREFGIMLREAGYRARFEPRVVATYHAPESLGDFSKQKKRNVGAMTQSLLRHSKLLFNPRYGWYGLLIFPEYSLFRILRVYLLILSFLLAAVYCAVFEPASAVSLLTSMLVAVFGCYLFGTALLAPLVNSPARFLMNIIASLPAMVIVAAYMATASTGYFRGDFSAVWERVKRDRTV